jgi:hypothetical protein
MVGSSLLIALAGQFGSLCRPKILSGVLGILAVVWNEHAETDFDRHAHAFCLEKTAKTQNYTKFIDRADVGREPITLYHCSQ